MGNRKRIVGIRKYMKSSEVIQVGLKQLVRRDVNPVPFFPEIIQIVEYWVVESEDPSDAVIDFKLH